MVEQDGAIKAWIKEAPLTCRAARAGTAVQEKCGFARGVPAALPINPMLVAHLEQTTRVWFYWRELHRHVCVLLALCLLYVCIAEAADAQRPLCSLREAGEARPYFGRWLAKDRKLILEATFRT